MDKIPIHSDLHKYGFHDILICMKTTIDISDTLFKEAKKFIVQKGQTFREVVEAALRLYLESQRQKRRSFKWRHKPFKGKGMVEGLQEGDWDKIRERVYEGRGG